MLNFEKKVGGVRGAKKAINQEIPDLDFRGGKVETEEKTPREQSIEKVETHIEELGKQIEELEEQTPERIEEKKKTAECLVLIRRENRLPVFPGHIDSISDGIKAIDRINFVPQYNAAVYYSEQFGENALKKALLEGLSTKVDEIVQAEKAIFESNNAKYRGFGVFNEEQVRGKVEGVLQKKIELDFAKEKAEKFEEANRAKSITEQAKSILEKKEVAKSQLPQVVRMELSYKDRLNEEVKLIQSIGATSFSPYSPAVAESLEAESYELIELQKQLKGVRSDFSKTRELWTEKSKKGIGLLGKFLGKTKTHEADLQSFEKKMSACTKNIEELEDKIELQKRKDVFATKEIPDLSKIVQTAQLVEGRGRKNMTIGQLLYEAKTVFEKYQSQKLTPEQEEIRKRYYETQEELRKANREYSIAKEKI